MTTLNLVARNTQNFKKLQKSGLQSQLVSSRRLVPAKPKDESISISKAGKNKDTFTSSIASNKNITFDPPSRELVKFLSPENIAFSLNSALKDPRNVKQVGIAQKFLAERSNKSWSKFDGTVQYQRDSKNNIIAKRSFNPFNNSVRYEGKVFYKGNNYQVKIHVGSKNGKLYQSSGIRVKIDYKHAK
jgi:hypothetical protein